MKHFNNLTKMKTLEPVFERCIVTYRQKSQTHITKVDWQVLHGGDRGTSRLQQPFKVEPLRITLKLKYCHGVSTNQGIGIAKTHFLLDWCNTMVTIDYHRARYLSKEHLMTVLLGLKTDNSSRHSVLIILCFPIAKYSIWCCKVKEPPPNIHGYLPLLNSFATQGRIVHSE